MMRTMAATSAPQASRRRPRHLHQRPPELGPRRGIRSKGVGLRLAMQCAMRVLRDSGEAIIAAASSSDLGRGAPPLAEALDELTEV